MHFKVEPSADGVQSLSTLLLKHKVFKNILINCFTVHGFGKPTNLQGEAKGFMFLMCFN